MRTPWDDDERLMHPPVEARDSYGEAFERLVGIMARLRAPAGCPWDRAQDLGSLRAYLIEEAYEVLQAVEEEGADAHREELGDLLLQIVFHAELRREAGEFDAADVVHGICDKLIRRHPHVFGDAAASGASEAFEHWEQIKAKEKAGRSAIDGVPRRLPALLRAQRITEKASRIGFDWKEAAGPLAKLREEIAELETAIAGKDRAEIEHELGDLLFSIVNVARFLDVGAEDALNAATARFSRRFRHVEQAVRGGGRQVSAVAADELDALWEEAKARERSADDVS